MNKHPNKIEFRNAVSKGPLSRKRAAKNKDLWSIGREGIYRDAVYEAYLDICRTCKGIGNSGDDKDAVFQNLAQQLERLIRTGVNNQDEFENEHENLCGSFISGFHGFEMNYGKAQKVVNMAFKYLYCCDGCDNTVFQYCHMPLDSKTLTWCRTWCNNKDYQLGIRADITLSKLDKQTYLSIQNAIRNRLKDGKAVHKVNEREDPLPKTPLDAEFIIWAREMRKNQ